MYSNPPRHGARIAAKDSLEGGPGQGGKLSQLAAHHHVLLYWYASHTVTHSFGINFNEEKWANEVVGEAELLVRFGGVNPADIKGMRAPFLAVGGDKMFYMFSRSPFPHK